MVLDNPMHENRKRDHIELALKAQTQKFLRDDRFYYEPLLSGHPNEKSDLSLTFLSKKCQAPFWVSSMTGGVGEARHINQNLAKLCGEMKMGMGLGSCRVLLESTQYFEDFNLRPILGEEVPFFANLGIAQLEKLFAKNHQLQIIELLKSLKVDGLVIHVNPLQEWYQEEGDRFLVSPLETIKKTLELCKNHNFKIIVKEVGQGMGPQSLKALSQLPIDAVELAGFGGTNFAKLEILRKSQGHETPEFFKVGHTALEMLGYLKQIDYKFEIIISGGIENALDGYDLMSLSKNPCVIGFAQNFLSRAENYEELVKYTKSQIESLKLAKSYLTPKGAEER
jgi:isopentenyl-diphosphate delta-isomerase